MPLAEREGDDVRLDAMSGPALERSEEELEQRYAELTTQGLDLNLTRGNPAGAQLELCAALDGTLDGAYRTEDGIDTRGYGGTDGIAEARRLGAAWLGLAPEEVLVGGNSSLTLMYLFLLGAHRFGLDGPGSAWADNAAGARFLCPVPGYDRHFSVCEDLGIDMIPVPMTGEGPDMDCVERLVGSDPGIRGMWCVPRFSNPTGETCSAETVRRIAALGRIASPGFRVMWDNAYAVHRLAGDAPTLENVMPHCRSVGTEDSVVQFGSTSKVTFAGSGISFFGGSRRNVDWFRQRLSVLTIGPDKVNQLRHMRLLPDMDAVRAHMDRHTELLRPKFDSVRRRLEEGLGNLGMGRWTDPSGGYFVSFWTLPGLAKETVRLAAGAGVRLTPAGAAFPYGDDPEDSHIRLAPSFPPLPEVDRAMEVFVVCVKLAAVRSARRARQV